MSSQIGQCLTHVHVRLPTNQAHSAVSRYGQPVVVAGYIGIGRDWIVRRGWCFDFDTAYVAHQNLGIVVPASWAAALHMHQSWILLFPPRPANTRSLKRPAIRQARPTLDDGGPFRDADVLSVNVEGNHVLVDPPARRHGCPPPGCPPTRRCSFGGEHFD